MKNLSGPGFPLQILTVANERMIRQLADAPTACGFYAAIPNAKKTNYS